MSNAAIPSLPTLRAGAIINVVDTTSLALLDANGLTIGTPIYCLATDSEFVLTISTASLSSDVVAVAGFNGLRWINQGGSSGFVTVPALASTTVTSGATLVGVNNPAGRFDQASLQGVLNADVVVRVDLAASDGTGGTSLIASQNTGAYWSGIHGLEAITQAIGAKDVSQDASITALTTGSQTIANPTAFALSNTHTLEADLSATSTSVVEDLLIEKRLTAGTAAVGMGVRNRVQMPDTSGTARDVWTEEVSWTAVGATTGSDVSKKETYLSGLGSGTGLQLSMRLTGGGNGQAQFQSGNVAGSKPGVSFSVDPRYGMGIDGNNSLSLSSGAGNQVVAISATGLGVFGKIATPAAPGSVGAAATNNVTPSGSSNVYPDFTNGTVYATDYASLHATISQMAAKLTAIETSLRAMGLIVT